MNSSSNLAICISAVLPMFLILCMGYGIRLTRLVNDELLRKLNALVFKTTFPFMIFENIYDSELDSVFDMELVVFVFVAIAAEYITGTFLTLAIEKSPKSRGAMIQAIYRSNFVIMGIPIANSIYGSGNIGITALLIAIVIPAYNVLAVTTLEVYRNRKPDFKMVLLHIAKNPLIIGAAAGLAAVIAGIRLPGPVDTAVSDVAAIGTPAALLILGGSFKFEKLGSMKRNISIICMMRLLIVPVFTLSIAYLMGFTDIEFVSLVAIFASPCAISSFTMAQEMDSDGELAGAAVVFTSAICSFTMFIILYLFKWMGAF